MDAGSVIDESVEVDATPHDAWHALAGPGEPSWWQGMELSAESGGTFVERWSDADGTERITRWSLRPPGGLLAAGALIGLSAVSGQPRVGSISFLANVFVAITYALVGYPLVRTQIRRRLDSGSWSVAGLALSGVFPTCALTHFVYALEASGDTHTAVTDLWGVPASIYFLFVVHGIYGDAIVDWNQRPATGRRRVTARRPPWSGATPG